MRESNLLMVVASVILGVAGIVCLFLPAELLVFMGMAPAPAAEGFVQITGALYIGFAAMDWAARAVLIGGIYSRPLALGNFFHFATGTIVLIELAIPMTSLIWLAVAAIYALLAIWFGRIIFFKSAV